MNKNIPAVSIVIPMYNAEKYIGDCLYNILIQTFQDFEVIVVDDRSTDRSYDVVESYLPKFNVECEKLKLFRRKFNSGNPSAPTNEGLTISRGEYLLILDDDDLITKTALEELYTIAKKFDADVVHCEKFLHFLDGQENFQIESYQTGEFVETPTLLTDDILQRVHDLRNGRFIWNLWTKLIRRDFLFENNIEMIDVMAQDVLFTWFMVLTAKRYVRVPNIVNIYRIRQDSLFHKKESIQKTIHQRVHAVSEGFNHFSKFLDEMEILKTRPDKKYEALEQWVSLCCDFLLRVYAQALPVQLDAFIRNEFSKVHDKTGLMAFIFNRMNIFDINIKRQSKIIQQQNQIIQQLQEQVKQLQQN